MNQIPISLTRKQNKNARMLSTRVPRPIRHCGRIICPQDDRECLAGDLYLVSSCLYKNDYLEVNPNKEKGSYYHSVRYY